MPNPPLYVVHVHDHTGCYTVPYWPGKYALKDAIELCNRQATPSTVTKGRSTVVIHQNAAAKEKGNE